MLNMNQSRNSVAMATSPWFQVSRPQCHLNFSINMYGINVGVLNVFIARSHRTKREIWKSYQSSGTR